MLEAFRLYLLEKTPVISSKIISSLMTVGENGVGAVVWMFVAAACCGILLAAALYYPKKQYNKNPILIGDCTFKKFVEPDNNNLKTKKNKKTPICPFSKDTNFIVEMAADTVPIAPLEQTSYQGPNAARWLAYGISGQDTPGKLRAGLKRLRDSTYFLVEDENLAVELALKEHNFKERRDVCFVMEKDSILAQQEVLDLFLSYLPRRYPHIYKYDATLNTIYVTLDNNTNSSDNANVSSLESSKTIKEFRIDDYSQAPLELCERIVQEDLILMRPDDTTKTTNSSSKTKIHSYHMAAAAVVFSFRDLVQKLGQPAEWIHAPVPHFRDHIQKSLNLMFTTLTAEKPLWRNNWGIASTGTLDEPLYGSTTAHQERRMSIVTVDEVKQKYLKVEYQTIRRLPKSNYLLFTVKTMVNPLEELETVPTAAACLASSIRGMSTAMHRYKGIDDDDTCSAILNYLDDIAAPSAVAASSIAPQGEGMKHL